MFFLLRMAFWLGVVLILLPTGGTQRAPAGSEVNATDAITAASATVHDLKGFCGREPSACTVGSQLATTIGYRAQAGAKMLYELLTEALASHDAGLAGGERRQAGADDSVPAAGIVGEHAHACRSRTRLARTAAQKIDLVATRQRPTTASGPDRRAIRSQRRHRPRLRAILYKRGRGRLNDDRY